MPEALRRRHETRTVATLFAGYTGYYVCRSNLSVAGPLLLDELKDTGFDKGDFGLIATIGVFAYTLGKIAHGILADRTHGRSLFLLGMFGSVAMTVAFGLASGFGWLALLWGLNRWFQSMGWVALVRVASAWFPPVRMASVMGILSASFLIGDALARGWLGSVVTWGGGWRTVFLVAAATLLPIATVAAFVLRARPADVGLDEPEAAVGNVFGTATSQTRVPIREVLATVVANRVFWLMCAVNFGLTLLRETFNTWSPVVLNEVGGLEEGAAAVTSLVFPAAGGVAAIVAGRLTDRAGSSPARIAIPFTVLLVVSLAALAWVPLQGQGALTALLLITTAFFLLGPYSFMSGVMAIRLGGKVGCSTVSGLCDAAGYCGGMVAGWGIGELAQAHGWTVAFGFLAGVGLVTLALVWAQHRVESRAERTEV